MPLESRSLGEMDVRQDVIEDPDVKGILSHPSLDPLTARKRRGAPGERETDGDMVRNRNGAKGARVRNASMRETSRDDTVREGDKGGGGRPKG
jgi:hypothetical protein